MSAIQRVEPAHAELATVAPMNIGDMMQAIIEKGITQESVAVMKDLLAMKREMDAEGARAAFNRDFLALRKECRPIAATRTIPTKDGGVKGRFASLEDIVGEVSPLLEKYGFSDTYSQSNIEGGRTKVVVTLLHTSGHERSSEYSCREHSSPQNTPAQNDGGTNKMARRHALCNMLGIVLDYSQDARLEGDTITPEEAAILEERVARITGGDADQVARYLRLAGAPSFAEVRRAKYDVVMAALDQHRQPTEKPQSIQAKPFPGAYDDATSWRDAMLEEMRLRWDCTAKIAAGSFDAMLAKAGASSYVAVPIESRKTAWSRLTTGSFDAAYAPKK